MALTPEARQGLRNLGARTAAAKTSVSPQATDLDKSMQKTNALRASGKPTGLTMVAGKTSRTPGKKPTARY